MDITRTIKTMKVHAVYYNPELVCEVSEDVDIIGEKSNDDIEKILSKRRPLFIRFEIIEEKEETYGMTAEDFIAHHTFTKPVKESK